METLIIIITILFVVLLILQNWMDKRHRSNLKDEINFAKQMWVSCYNIAEQYKEHLLYSHGEVLIHPKSDKKDSFIIKCEELQHITNAKSPMKLRVEAGMKITEVNGNGAVYDCVILEETVDSYTVCIMDGKPFVGEKAETILKSEFVSKYRWVD